MSGDFPKMWFALSAIAEGLTRVPVAVLGKFVKGKQQFSITRQTLRDIVADFRSRAIDTVIDYEHASEFPEVAQGQPVPAAGWLKAIDDAPDGDGVLWGQVEFTPRAAQMLADKEYKYFSPVIVWGARDKHSGDQKTGASLISGALTNRPFLEDMPAIAMSDGWEKIDRGDAVDAAAEQLEVVHVRVILTDRVAGTVNVVDDDGKTTALKVEGLEPLTVEPKTVRLSDVKRDKDGRYDFATLPQDEGTLIASDVLHGMQVQSALDEAMKAGKITAAQRPTYEKLALSDLAGFRSLMVSQKPVVDLKERGTGSEGLKDARSVQMALNQEIADKRKARPGLGYSQALKLVASEKPDLMDAKARFAARGGR